MFSVLGDNVGWCYDWDGCRCVFPRVWCRAVHHQHPGSQLLHACHMSNLTAETHCQEEPRWHWKWPTDNHQLTTGTRSCNCWKPTLTNSSQLLAGRIAMWCLTFRMNLELREKKERKCIYIAPFIYYVYLKSLRHGSHSFTCKYTMPAFHSYAFTRWHHL